MDFLSEIFLETQYEYYEFKKADLKEAAGLLDKNTDWSWEGIKKIYTSIMRSVFEEKDAEYLHNYYSNEYMVYIEKFRKAEKKAQIAYKTQLPVPEKDFFQINMQYERVFPCTVENVTNITKGKRNSTISGKEYEMFSQNERFELDLVLQGFGEDYIIAAMLEVLYENEPRTVYKEYTSFSVKNMENNKIKNMPEYEQWEDKYKKWKKRMEAECYHFPNTWKLPELVENINAKDSQSSFLITKDDTDPKIIKFFGKYCDIELFKIIYQGEFWGLFDGGIKERKNLEEVKVGMLERMFDMQAEPEEDGEWWEPLLDYRREEILMPNLILKIYGHMVNKYGEMYKKNGNKNKLEFKPDKISKSFMEANVLDLIYSVMVIKNPYFRLLAVELFMRRQEKDYRIYYPKEDGSIFLEKYFFNGECVRCNEKLAISTNLLEKLIDHYGEKESILSESILNDLGEYRHKLGIDLSSFKEKIICFEELKGKESYKKETGSLFKSITKHLYRTNGFNSQWLAENNPIRATKKFGFDWYVDQEYIRQEMEKILEKRKVNPSKCYTNDKNE